MGNWGSIAPQLSEFKKRIGKVLGVDSVDEEMLGKMLFEWRSKHYWSSRGKFKKVLLYRYNRLGKGIYCMDLKLHTANYSSKG